MKFLLVKAILGFGDRLEYLAMCVEYAQKFKLKLLIDWSDPVWGDSFYSYFKLDIPTFALSDITDDMTVYPEYWKGRLDKQMTKEIDRTPLELNRLISQQYSADVIVAASYGFRTLYTDYRFFSSICSVIDPRIITAVKERQQKYSLKDKWCIHLRGTDRFKTFERKQRRFRELLCKLLHHGLLNHGGGCIVVSDDPDYVKLWGGRVKDSPILSTIIDSKGQGLHNATSETLGITKEEQNVNLLIDFFTMASCKQIFSTSNDSRFARMAGKFKPFISLML
jgi:hypothetical protein